MFKLFRRRRDKPSVMYGVFQRLGQAIEKRQRKAADRLNAKVAGLSKRQLKAGLLLFCLLFGGGAGFVIWQALNAPVKTIKVQPIHIPQHAILPKNETPDDALLTKEEIRHIQQFQHYLDSLQQTPKGKATYDSIAKYRPGLLDSLAFITRFYQEQLKTK